jgi:hypothetical protein
MEADSCTTLSVHFMTLTVYLKIVKRAIPCYIHFATILKAHGELGYSSVVEHLPGWHAKGARFHPYTSKTLRGKSRPRAQ